ncbi:MAG TPA: hypothetical protein VMX57_05595 [Planctomycetota bacterium]|nr:hypothetical protein [Planctomycetota bacterium]
MEESHCEKCAESPADTVERAVRFDHGHPAKRPGALAAKLRKRDLVEDQTCPIPTSS